MIDLRTGEEMIPGESCVLLQPCPVKDSLDTSLDLRSGEEELIPGIDCLETVLPPCPIENYSNGMLDLRTAEELIPGETCQPLPPCPVQTDSSLDLRTGEEMLDLRSGEELIPGETCMPLPLCPVQ